MTVNQELLEIAYQVAGDRIEGALYNAKQSCPQQSRRRAQEEVKTAILEKYPGGRPISRSHRRSITCRKRRSASAFSTNRSVCDGRGYQDIRPITCEVGVASALARLRDFPARRNAGARACRHWRRSKKRRISTATVAARLSKKLSSCITIFRRSASAKPAEPAARAAAKSVTARWPSVRSSRSFRARKISRTRFASRAKSWNRTVRPRWPAFAAACLR